MGDPASQLLPEWEKVPCAVITQACGVLELSNSGAEWILSCEGYYPNGYRSKFTLLTFSAFIFSLALLCLLIACFMFEKQTLQRAFCVLSRTQDALMCHDVRSFRDTVYSVKKS